nr:MAG TPA: hypothetical protein [Caudoviricetes sp.]
MFLFNTASIHILVQTISSSNNIIIGATHFHSKDSHLLSILALQPYS